MADKRINDLPVASELNDDSLLVVQQDTTAKSIKGSLVKSFAVAAAKEQADKAAACAIEAAGYVDTVAASAQAAAQSATNAASSEIAAGAAQTAAESAKTAAETAKTQAVSAKDEANTANTNAQSAKTAAEKAKTDAQSAQTAAESAKTAAQNAQTAAETAKTNAQGSATSASSSATQANTSATNAADSAETAKQYSGKPPKPQGGYWYIWNATTQQYENSNVKCTLSIDKTYASIAEMNADAANVEVNTMAIIVSTLSDVDNNKLFIREDNTTTPWHFLGDLSGVQGVGVQSIELTSGNHAPGTTDTYTITYTDGSTSTYQVYNGADGTGTGDMLAADYDADGAVKTAGGIKAYADTKLSLSGGTMTGEICLKSILARINEDFSITQVSPAISGSAALLSGFIGGPGGNDAGGLYQYAKNGLAIIPTPTDKDISLAIETMTSAGAPGTILVLSNIDMQNCLISKLGTPVADTDAANKKYVDDAAATKQNKLTGTAGQVVGFDASGDAVAQEAPAGVEAATETPLSDGTAAVGTSEKYAREDHVHPSDDTKLSKSGGTMTGRVLFTDNRFQLGELTQVEGSTYPYFGLTTHFRGSSAYDGSDSESDERGNGCVLVRGALVKIGTLSSGDGTFRNVPCVDIHGLSDPTATYDAANKKYVDAQKPIATLITLSTSGWSLSTKKQTVTVNGVLADESKQLILPMPAMASRTAYNDAGVQCSAQAADSLTFVCDTVPTADLSVYVTVQGVVTA